MSCSHLLQKGGHCPCGWVAPPPEPEPFDHTAWSSLCDGWAKVGAAHAAVAKKARSAQCRRRLSWFVRDAYEALNPGQKLTWTWYLEAMCDHVQWILEGWRRAKRTGQRARYRNLLINVPPGAAKTFVVSVCAPAWMWIDSPEWSVLCLSVNPAVARDAAVMSRMLINSDWYVESFVLGVSEEQAAAAVLDEADPDNQAFDAYEVMPVEALSAWEMSEDRDTQSKFVNTCGGFRASQGMSAQIIGLRADAVFLDDPNDPSASQEQNMKILAKFGSVIWNRVKDLDIAVRIVIQQRTDADDLSGFCERTYNPPDQVPTFVVLRLPLLSDPSRRCKTPLPVDEHGVYCAPQDFNKKAKTWEDLREGPGVCLSDVRYPKEDVLPLQGQPKFALMYQQDASSLIGEHFAPDKWGYWRRADEEALPPSTRPEGYGRLPAEVVAVRRDVFGGGLAIQSVWVTMDATMGSEKNTASHVGLLACAQWGKKILVLHDEDPKQQGLPGQLAALDRCIRAAVTITGHLHVKLLIEEKALGLSIAKAVRTHVAEAGYYLGDVKVAVDVETCNPGKDDKTDRGYAMEPTQATGMILLPQGAPWIEGFIREFRRFPKRPNDKVDSLGQLVSKLAPRPGSSWRGFVGSAGRVFS